MFSDAEAYERFVGRWSRLLAPLLVNFAALPDEGRMLDVGSGTGSLAFAIAERKPRAQITGIDPSKEFVAFANSRNPFPGRVRFEVGDAQKMAFPDAAFSDSLALLVMNFIPDPDKALAEMRRVTRAGGVIAAANWDYGDGMQMLRVFFDAAASVDPSAAKRDEKHMPLCRAGELSQFMRHGGLEKVEEQPLSITMRFASFGDYWDPFLLGQGPAGSYARSLSQEQLQALREELKRRLHLSSEDAPFELSARVWAARGIVPARG